MLHASVIKICGVQLEEPDQADAELLTLVMHKDASAALCLAALSAAIQAPCCIALKSATDMVLERFAEDATVPPRIIKALLTASEEKVSHSAGQYAAQAPLCDKSGSQSGVSAAVHPAARETGRAEQTDAPVQSIYIIPKQVTRAGLQTCFMDLRGSQCACRIHAWRLLR